MSALSEYQPERVAITHKDKPLITVRGLSLSDVTVLFSKHLADIRVLVDLYDRRASIFSDFEGVENALLLRLLADFPDLMAQLIANASDEPDQAAQIRCLPLAIQVQALYVIVRLTMEDMGGPNGAAALMKKLLKTAKK